MAKGQRALLPPEEEQRLKELATSGPDILRQRARVILAWHEGDNVNDVARKTRLTVHQVQYLWRSYKSKGLDLFLADAESAPTSAPRRHTPKTEPAPEPAPEPGITLEALLKANGVDMGHARRVAQLALQIFDATSALHRLPQSLRPLLETAALVHNVGLQADAENHHTRGRDLLMAEPIQGFSDDERRILAVTTAFHRKRVRPDAEPVFQALPPDLQQDALHLSAILRMADGLDYSGSRSTNITAIQAEPEELIIEVSGPQAASDKAQAQKKSDLWVKVMGGRVRILEAMPEPASPSAPAPLPLRAMTVRTPPVEATMSVTRAAQSVALAALDRLDTLLQVGQSGDLSLARTLARDADRLAEAVALVDPKLLRKELQWLSDALEQVYIASALAERALTVAEETGESALNARVLTWEAEARELMKAFDMARYHRLADELRRELAARAPKDAESAAIGYHAGAILWGQLATLRAVMEHGESVQSALHAARQLQDTLYALRGLLGSEVAQTLDILTPLESYLAALHTTQAVLERLERSEKPARKSRKAAVADESLTKMRKAQQEILESLADELPGIWAGVNSAIFRRAFALAIAAP